MASWYAVRKIVRSKSKKISTEKVVLVKAETNNKKEVTYFSPVSSANCVKQLFENKHINTYLRAIAMNDAILGRTSKFGIDYNDGSRLAPFSLLPVSKNKIEGVSVKEMH